MAKNQKPRSKIPLQNKKGPVTIFYSDTFNYVDLAAIIRDQFFAAIEDHNTMGGPLTEDDVDIIALANFLEMEFQPDALAEFANTQFGRGILLGAYLERSQNEARTEETEALNAMEDDF